MSTLTSGSSIIFSSVGDGGEGGIDAGSWNDTRLGVVVVFVFGVFTTPFGVDDSTGGLGGVALVSTWLMMAYEDPRSGGKGGSLLLGPPNKLSSRWDGRLTCDDGL